MKPDLKRIEEALNQLEMLKGSTSPQSSIARTIDSVEVFLSQKTKSPQEQLSTPTQALEEDKEIDLSAPNTGNSCDRLDTDISQDRVNSLPQTQIDADNEAKLDLVVQQIKDLYYEGPMIDGWLEYYPSAPEPSAGTLREIIFERISDDLGIDSSFEFGTESCKSSHASYRVCGIDSSGQQWSYLCPLDQLLSVSIAIARYHKLQQLLQQKYYIETYLKREQVGEHGSRGDKEDKGDKGG